MKLPAFVKPVWPVALIAMVIAACLPFDRALTAITWGNTPAHALLVGGMALAGGWMGQRAGLNPRGSVAVGLWVALGGAAYVLLLDVVVFHGLLRQGVLALAHMPLVGRLGVFMARAFNENVIYRLFGFSAVMLGLRQLYGGGAVPLGMVLLAGLVVQGVNIGVNVWLAVDHVPTLIELVYWSLRYVAPGVLWAWLYWRYGFLTTEIASVGGHLFLQPLYGVLV
jgi:hypothetical protein